MAVALARGVWAQRTRRLFERAVINKFQGHTGARVVSYRRLERQPRVRSAHAMFAEAAVIRITLCAIAVALLLAGVVVTVLHPGESDPPRAYVDDISGRVYIVSRHACVVDEYISAPLPLPTTTTTSMHCGSNSTAAPLVVCTPVVLCVLLPNDTRIYPWTGFTSTRAPTLGDKVRCAYDPDRPGEYPGAIVLGTDVAVSAMLVVGASLVAAGILSVVFYAYWEHHRQTSQRMCSLCTPGVRIVAHPVTTTTTTTPPPPLPPLSPHTTTDVAVVDDDGDGGGNYAQWYDE